MSPLLLSLLLALSAVEPAAGPPTGPGGDSVRSAPAPAQAPVAAEALRYADWLFAHGDHYRAIGEYQRALYLDPAAATAGPARLQMARAYAAGGQADAAVTLLRELAAEEGPPAVRDAALFEQALTRYRAGQPELALAPLAAYVGPPDPRGGPGPVRARLLLSLARLRCGDVAGARLELDRLPSGARLDAGTEDPGGALRAAIDEVARAPRRSPLAAGLLSAALPGLGHAYAGDPWGGASALALNGAFLWATVEAYRDGRPGLGTLLLVGESIWYAGAIFGAVAEAQRFTRDAREAALGRAERRIEWVLQPVPGGVVAGARVTTP